MKKLKKLIFAEYIYNLLVISLALTIAVFIFDLLEFSDELISLPIKDIIFFLLLRIPYFLSYTLIYAVVMASVLSLANLANRFELVAIYTSAVSAKKINLYYLLLIFITSLIAFLNEAYVSPYCYRYSMILIGKEKSFTDLEIKEIAIKHNDSFLFIESIENAGKLGRNMVEIKLDKEGLIKEIGLHPMIEKKEKDWFSEKGFYFDEYGTKKDFSGKIDLNLSDALLNLGYKPKALTNSDINRLCQFGEKFNIDISRYSGTVSERLLHILTPMLIFIFFSTKVPPVVDDRKRLHTAVKLIFFLICYNIFEANVYKYAVANKIKPVFPFLINVFVLSVMNLRIFTKSQE